MQGATFSSDQERSAESAPVVVISHRLSKQGFGDSEAVGRQILLNGVSTTIVGVAPEGFQGPELLADVDVWAPGPVSRAMIHLPPAPGPNPLDRRAGGTFNRFFGRLAPGATADEAAVQLQAVGKRIYASYPTDAIGYRDAVAVTRLGLVGRLSDREGLERVMQLLAGLGVALFAIAAANVINLYLFRLAARQDEVAIRRAIGAGTMRLIRQRLAQSLLVAGAAAVAAVVLAMLLLRFFTGVNVAGLTSLKGIALDWRVFAFTVAMALAGGVILGLVPAAWERKIEVLPELKRSGTRSVSAAPRFRRILSVTQLALSVTLLVGALLFVSTLRNLRRLDLGFDPRSVTAYWFVPRNAGYSPDSTLGLFRTIVPKVRALPGVEEVSVANFTPYLGFTLQTAFFPDGKVSADTLRANSFITSGSYFKTLGIPLKSGRTFSDIEDATPALSGVGVVVVSERAAQRFFGTVNVVGRHLRPRGPLSPVSKATDYEIIGVVGDGRFNDLTRADLDPAVYRPLNEAGSTMVLLVRSAPTGAIRSAVSNVLSSIAPTVPISTVATLAETLNERLGEQRLFVKISALTTVLAILLATVGVYALVAVSVAERRREFGIRMALGARGEQVRGIVLRQGMWVGGVGVVLGLLGGFGVAKLIAGRLYGVTAKEPTVYLAAAVGLGLVVMLASYLPARAATTVDPVVVLRSD